MIDDKASIMLEHHRLTNNSRNLLEIENKNYNNFQINTSSNNELNQDVKPHKTSTT